jgi:hypothetical protein
LPVSPPRLELKANAIHITYNILNSDPAEMYMVNLTVTDGEGIALNALTLDGDVGSQVTGGNNKLIVWNLEADNVLLTSRIYAKIHVQTIPGSDSGISQAGIQPSDKTNSSNLAGQGGDLSGNSKSPGGVPTGPKTFNRTAIVFQSLVVPGLGLSRVTRKPHWIRGVAGYGCIAGSLVMNKQAIATYNSISDSNDYEEMSRRYEKAVQQDNISEILAYAAVGVWVTDFIWTLIATSDLKKGSTHMNTSGFSLKTNIDPMTYSPMVGIKYGF